MYMFWFCSPFSTHSTFSILQVMTYEGEWFSYHTIMLDVLLLMIRLWTLLWSQWLLVISINSNLSVEKVALSISNKYFILYGNSALRGSTEPIVLSNLWNVPFCKANLPQQHCKSWRDVNKETLINLILYYGETS